MLYASRPITNRDAMRLALCALRMNMYIPLRKGNNNTRLAKRFIDVPIQLVNYLSLVVGPMGPAQQFKIKG